MTGPAIQRTQQITQPDLVDVLHAWKKDIMMALNCHAIGKISSFNSSNQTAVVQIAYKKTYFDKQPNGTFIPVLKDYPPLLDVPVVILSGGSAWLNMPIAVGQECFIYFNDRSIDNWFATGQIGPVSSPRMHSTADAVAIVGVRSLANSLASYDTVRALLTDGNASAGINPTTHKVTLKNQTNGTFGAAMTILTNALQAFMTTTASATTAPQIAAAAVTFNSAIGQAITNIQGLFE